jgi:superfamily II RNA helicase
METYLTTHVVPAEVKAVFAERDRLENAMKAPGNAARKKAQSDLDKWRSEHRSAEWIKKETDVKNEKLVLKKRTQIDMEIEGYQCENDSRRFEPVLKALKACGAFDGTALTPLGIAATECNEANPLLMAKLYTSQRLKGATVEEIVGVLASLVVDREAQEKSTEPTHLSLSPLVCETLLKMDDWSQIGVGIDQDCLVASPQSFWCLTTMWADIVTKWLGGISAPELCAEYEVFPGNFMRGLLKVNNVVQEWISICTLHADVEQLATLDGIQERLMRDIVIPESLYLRL